MGQMQKGGKIFFSFFLSELVRFWKKGTNKKTWGEWRKKIYIYIAGKGLIFLVLIFFFIWFLKKSHLGTGKKEHFQIFFRVGKTLIVQSKSFLNLGPPLEFLSL